MNSLPDAVARLQRSRDRWQLTMDRDLPAGMAQPRGMLGAMLQGLGGQPWLSAASALWLAWRRRQPGPGPVQASMRQRGPTGARLRPTRLWPLAATAVIAGVMAGVMWWRHRPQSADRSNPPS